MRFDAKVRLAAYHDGDYLQQLEASKKAKMQPVKKPLSPSLLPTSFCHITLTE